ncbi:hypothetical protein [Xanthomonas euvesicatoria]|uniref:hypothetical protein n=1 Tax=Xanthomonas euvesicatoria TaxID=456327 RepID=UPI001C471D86|nr:hypothetical protein [Xanthomonas euvesicatoria]MBV6842740.1 hypothetical protein [Xanthomonas campestris pv. fici]
MSALRTMVKLRSTSAATPAAHWYPRETVQDGNAWIVGNTPGFRTKVDLAADVPPLQESQQQLRALDAQRAQPEMTTPTPTRVM